MIRLSAFGDEIAHDFEEQLKHLVKMNINYIELRNLWEKGVLTLSDDERKRARDLLRKYGIQLSAVGSPIGKVPITDPADNEIERLKLCMETAHYFGAPYIRMFSYYIPEGESPDKYRDEVMERLRRMVEIAEKEGIALMLENEADLYGEKGDKCADILDTIDSPFLKMAFDPANFVCAGQHPFDECFELVRKHIKHLHIKDCKLGTKEMVLAGKGDGQIAQVMRALKADGYDGFATMEPHLSVAGRMSGFSGPEKFAEAVDAYRGILDAEGIRNRQIRVAVVGAGNIGKFHAAALQGVSESHLIAICDNVPEAAESLAEKMHVAAHTDFNELIARPDLDAIHICTPSGLHGEAAVAAANAGKHVLVEKPMEITLEKADAMIEAARENNVKLGVISQRRFDPDMRKIKEAVDSGRFGTMVVGDAFIKWYRSQEYYDSGDWRGTWEYDGGGCLMNQGIHFIDMLQWIMGPVRKIFARTATRARNIEVEDVAIANIEFESGAFGNIIGSTAVYPGLPERLEISGTTGSAVLEKTELLFWDVEGEEGGGPIDVKKDTSAAAKDPMKIDASGHQNQFRDFAEAVMDNREPFIPGEEGRRPVEIILAIYESGKLGKEISLPLNTSLGSPSPDIL